MQISRKNLKFIIFSFSLVVFLLVKLFSFNNLTKAKDLNRPDQNLHLNSNYNFTRTKSTGTLYYNLDNLNLYLSVVQDKQKQLLKEINGSAFHTIEKHAAIKHKYIHHANTIINDSNTSLKKENTLIEKILPFIANHPYTYNAYLNKAGLIIPNIDFFIKKNLIQDNSSNNITNISYNINSFTNLNNISTEIEEDTFNTKKLTKSSSAILNIIFRDYYFKANIIWFNVHSNLFEFKKLYKNKAKQNKLYKINKAQFIKSYSNKNHTILNYISKSNLTYLLSNYTYPGYFNLHTKECFKTHLIFGKIRKVSSNIVTYFVIPIFSTLIASTVVLAIFLIVNSKINNSKKFSFIRRIKIDLLKSKNNPSEDNELITPLETINCSCVIHKYSEGVISIPHKIALKEGYIKKESDTDDSLNTTVFNLSYDQSSKQGWTFDKNYIWFHNKNDEETRTKEIAIYNSERKLKFYPSDGVVANNIYKSNKIETKTLKSAKNKEKQKIKVIKLSKEYILENEEDGSYADITDFYNGSSDIILLPVRDCTLYLKVYCESDFI